MNLVGTALLALLLGIFLTIFVLWVAFAPRPWRKPPSEALLTGLPTNAVPTDPTIAIPIQKTKEYAEMSEADDLTTIYNSYPANFRLTGPVVVVLEDKTTISLRDWLVHYSHYRENAWPRVVSDFYGRAADEPEIADYFTGVDMAQLQRHFLAALMMVTSNGLTVGACQQMQERHKTVRNSAGETITPEVYDRIIVILTQVLGGHGVPRYVIDQVGRCIQPLREAITGEPAAEAYRWI